MLIRRIKRFFQIFLFNHKRFASNLTQIADLLARSKLSGRVWLVGGMVLGLIRDGKLLGHDQDADFAFLEEDHERFRRFIPVLIGAGFKPFYRWTNSAGQVVEYSFWKEGALFEFFVHFLSEDRQRVVWYSIHARNRLEMKREIPWHGTRPAALLGRTWFIPEKTEEYLERNYGRWRQPNPNFDYTKASSVPCGVGRRHWAGSRRWKD